MNLIVFRLLAQSSVNYEADAASRQTQQLDCIETNKHTNIYTHTYYIHTYVYSYIITYRGIAVSILHSLWQAYVCVKAFQVLPLRKIVIPYSFWGRKEYADIYMIYFCCYLA